MKFSRLRQWIYHFPPVQKEPAFLVVISILKSRGYKDFLA